MFAIYHTLLFHTINTLKISIYKTILTNKKIKAIGYDVISALQGVKHLFLD